MRRWSITTHVTGKPRTVDVILYETRAAMRAAGTRFNRPVSGKTGEYSNADGICHGFTRSSLTNDEWTEDETVAIIRLHKKALNALVLSHEIAHAAQHVYGLDYADDRSMDEHMHSGNENFAYLYGELFAAAYTALKNGFIDD